MYYNVFTKLKYSNYKEVKIIYKREKCIRKETVLHNDMDYVTKKWNIHIYLFLLKLQGKPLQLILF